MTATNFVAKHLYVDCQTNPKITLKEQNWHISGANKYSFASIQSSDYRVHEPGQHSAWEGGEDDILIQHA
jgi:hypothetical protein